MIIQRNGQRTSNCRIKTAIKYSRFNAIYKLDSRWQSQHRGIVSQPRTQLNFIPPTFRLN